MHTKDNLKLRGVGSRFMIVDAADDAAHTNVFTLNNSAAYLWQSVAGRDFTEEDMARLLTERYDVDEATALADVRAMLAIWRENGLIRES